MENSNLSSEELADEAAAAAVPTPVELNEELNEVYQFRNPDIDAEVWFVALGSELAQNSGMKAFLEAHQSELRGAFIVDIDAIGAGDLTMIEREGFLKPSKASSRMKRYIRKASQATGMRGKRCIVCGEAWLPGYPSGGHGRRQARAVRPAGRYRREHRREETGLQRGLSYGVVEEYVRPVTCSLSDWTAAGL